MTSLNDFNEIKTVALVVYDAELCENKKQLLKS